LAGGLGLDALEAGPVTAALPFSDPAAARAYIRAGRARVTLCSERTGTRYTFQVKENSEDPKTDPNRSFFVYLLKGPSNTSDYSYLGMIRGDRFFTTRATHHMDGAAFTKAFRHVYEHLSRRRQMPPGCVVWHESACGRCGRALTVPASIISGIGPECSRHVGR
jgi:hypothetical protein